MKGVSPDKRRGLPGMKGHAARFPPTALSVNAAKDVYFTARPRKLRAVLTGGDSTTALIAEVV